MAEATYACTSFLGGEISQLAQGRWDKPDYRTCMNVCLNGHPIEAGAWTRRAGTQYAGHTKGGAPGRVVKFDFQQSAAYTMEFVDGWVRWRAGTSLAMTNDAQVVVAISSANPAVVQTTSAHGWSTGNTVMFSLLGIGTPRLQNRQFTITKTDNTHFSLQDALTGANIDGSTLGALNAGTKVSRVQSLTTPYVAGQWNTLRSVQAETTSVLLQGSNAPQIMQVTTLPNLTLQAQFSLGALTFLDGPYLDPFTNGVQATPGSKVGNITLTLAFPAYDSTKAYKVDDFVTSAGTNYKSLTDDNVNNAPAGLAPNWATTSAGAAINGGQGFLGTDVGRLVRLYSEPAAWAVGTAYTTNQVVSYNPTNAPGGASYWSALANNTGNAPGIDLVNWKLMPTGAAVWSWGKIVSLANQISQTLAGVANIGSLTGGGGLAAAFDSVTNQSGAASANTVASVNNNYAYSDYVGRNFSGASAQAIASVTIYPPNNQPFVVFSGNPGPGQSQFVTFNLRAKATLPANATDGTLLATTGQLSQNDPRVTQPISLVSSDSVTTWNYVWVEYAHLGGVNPAYGGLGISTYCAEMQQFGPPGVGSGTAVVIELLGPPLLYTTPIVTWRLGAYSNTTGWPTCGCYHEGRLWLGGAVANRFDASVSNGLSGTTINFAPTDQNGVVAASNGVSYTLNSDGVNPMLWMTPDLQGILAGTFAGEWLIQPPSAGPMSPLNIAARRMTTIGSANVEPRRTEHTLIFVQRYARKLMEYFADVFSGKFTAPNLADRAMHLTKPGIAELAYQQAATAIIWARTTDGNLRGITYRRDTLMTAQGPTYAGWHRHTLGSGRTVESICVGPSVGGGLDALTMVTNDAATGIRHVEIMNDAPEEGVTLANASYVDDDVTPTSTTSSNSTPAPYGGLTLNGLWHLNGKTVTAWLGGLDCGDYVVTNGSITVPYGDSVSGGTAKGLFTAAFVATFSTFPMSVGFTFTSQGQLVRPATPQESGARSGPALGKKRRNHRFAALLEGTQGVSFGTTFAKVDAARFRDAVDVTIQINQQFSGVYKDSLTDTHSYDGMLCWQVTRPYIVNIAAVEPYLETQDA
jgi:hypothetical protein